MLLMGEPKKKFLEMESTGEDAVKIIEMTTKDLEYDVNLADKTVAGCERTGSTLRVVFLWIKCYQIVLHTPEKTCLKVLSHLEKLPQPSTTMIYQQASTMRQNAPPTKRLQLAEGSDDD